MNQDNGFKIFCPRCGNEMNSESRYCMKCGYLNTNNAANQNMKQYIPENESGSYQVGSGQLINQNNDNERIVNSISSNTGNTKLCFLVNYLVYIFIILMSFILTVGNNFVSIEMIRNSLFPFIVFVISIIFLYTYSMELIFIKCNKKWWYSLIPIYNLMILTEIVFDKKILGLLLLVPVVGQIFFLVILYILGNRFKYNGILSMLLPIIFIPLMGFGSRFYEGVNYISEDRTLEKDYKRKKIFFISLMIFLISSFILLFWTNILDVKNKAKRITNYYYVYASRKIVDETKNIANKDYLECEKYDYSSDSGVYYIKYNDIGNEVYLPFYYYRSIIEGYVIINNNTGKTYISITDGKYGYPELDINEVGLDKIEEYSRVQYKSAKDINSCINTKSKTNGGEL